MLNNLSLPGLDFATSSVTVPMWAVGAAGVVLFVFLLLAIFRAGFGEVIGAVVRIAFLVLAVGVAWVFVTRSADRDRADERHILDQRLAALTAQATAPNSALGCLEPGLSEAVDAACEKILFAGPETVGAASAFVAQRWAFLNDALDYVRTRDVRYDANLDGLRRSLQADRFGFLAQVLSEREGCTVAKCDALGKLSDPNRVRANMNEHVFDMLVARNAAAWPSRNHGGTPMAATAPAAPGPASTATFPSANSIPPVSIMSNEPAAAPAGTPANPSPAQAAKRPPPTPRAAPRPAAARPAPIGPPPSASTGSSTPSQQ